MRDITARLRTKLDRLARRPRPSRFAGLWDALCGAAPMPDDPDPDDLTADLWERLESAAADPGTDRVEERLQAAVAEMEESAPVVVYGLREIDQPTSPEGDRDA